VRARRGRRACAGEPWAAGAGALTPRERRRTGKTWSWSRADLLPGQVADLPSAVVTHAARPGRPFEALQHVVRRREPRAGGQACRADRTLARPAQEHDGPSAFAEAVLDLLQERRVGTAV